MQKNDSSFSHKVSFPVFRRLSFPIVVCWIACLLLLFPADLSAGKKKRRTLRQRTERLLGVADSLRLRMRYAADHGYMLQWVDTLYRERLRKGDIDSLKYRKLMRRLARIDGYLFSGDSLLALNYRKKNIDTAYIVRPGGRWTVKLRGNLSGAKLRIISSSDGVRDDMTVRSEYRGTMSVSVLYRGLGLGVAVNPAKWVGKGKDYEFNLNSYGNRFGFDIVYLASNTYSGSRTVGDMETSISSGMVRQKALNVNVYYAFNGRRFSFPAAFSQSYVQRQSAGSWMLGASFDGTRTDIRTSESADASTLKIRTAEVAIGAGYGYNFVAGHHWLFHLSALPTLTVYSHDYTKEEGVRNSMAYHFPSAVITGRGAALYAWRNKFLGATMVYNYSVAGDEKRLEVQRDKWRVRCFFGFRF